MRPLLLLGSLTTAALFGVTHPTVAGTNVFTVYGHAYIGRDQALPQKGYSLQVSIAHADGTCDELTFVFSGTEQGRYSVCFVSYLENSPVAESNDWATAILRDADGNRIGTTQELISAAAVSARLWNWELSTGISPARPGTWGGIKALWR